MPAVGVPVTLRMLSAPEPLRAEAEIQDRFEQRDRVLRLDLADLEIGARGDVRIAAAVALGEIGEARRIANA